jgi:hypothetical protein
VAISGMPVLINSGGAAGSGSLTSPEAPKAAKGADTAEPGAMEAPRPPKTLAPRPSVQAGALRVAAKHGAPFCEKCADAARAAALARAANPEEADQAAHEAGLAGAAAEETKTWAEFELRLLPEPPQPQKSWIGVWLVDQAATPVPDRPYRIVDVDGTAHRGNLEEGGTAKLHDLDDGPCRVSCLYLAPRASLTHIVAPGKHISGIAEDYGFDDYTGVERPAERGAAVTAAEPT